MYLMAGLLLVGFVCNLLVRPVDARHNYVPGRDEASDAGKAGSLAPRAAGATT